MSPTKEINSSTDKYPLHASPVDPYEGEDGWKRDFFGGGVLLWKEKGLCRVRRRFGELELGKRVRGEQGSGGATRDWEEGEGGLHPTAAGRHGKEVEAE